MRRPLAAWCAFWATFAVIDYAADRRGRALCHVVRHYFRTDTPTGRAIFRAVFYTGADVLHRHVVKQAR